MNSLIPKPTFHGEGMVGSDLNKYNYVMRVARAGKKLTSLVQSKLLVMSRVRKRWALARFLKIPKILEAGLRVPT